MKKSFVAAVFLFIFAAVLFVYKDSFSAYFFQDDWYSLKISSVDNPLQITGFFIPKPDTVYYRPLGMQVPFYLLKALFGINPLPFRVLTFLIHIFNSVLVYILCFKFLKVQKTSVLASFFYAVSPVHYIPFYWSATIAFVMGPAFFFLAFLYFLEYNHNPVQKNYILLILYFVLGILTFETIGILPLIFLLYYIFQRNFKKIWILLPLFLISGIYFSFRLLLSPPPDIPAYRLGLGVETLHNLKYYLLWSLSWPEEIRYQFVSLFTVNSQFIKSFGNYYLILVVSLTVNLLVLVFFPAVVYVIKKIKLDLFSIFFPALWFLSGILPVLFFPDHAFAYYLPVSLPAMLLLFFFHIQKAVDKFPKYKNQLITGFATVLVLNWLITSAAVIDVNKKIHWAPRRSRISRELTEAALKINPPDISPVFLVNPHPENRLALNDQEGLKIFLDNPRVRTLYTSEGSEGYRL